ncbi:SDR family oxidoreductase [Secundilactobacillus folii]|uniref:NAD(P)H-binding protein n=1 Tax=Secundilactobacillus folii TaxID=2678357 RepID=A0A7X2XV58_9LACO|nr:NAD(P)H-binding protein [Secundilactobacillus folii]MTV82267.1 NAD(P)H-binding protein [Secundilactobacillus folii]
MKMTLLGSVGNINRIVIPKLIAEGHDLTVVTSNPQRVAVIEATGARAVVGQMTDAAFLTKHFTGQDVVYLMVSGNPGTDLFGTMAHQADVFKTAVQRAGVKRVVDLSSIGAQDQQAGSLYTYHLVEDALSSLPDVDVAFVRPVGFYKNYYSHMASIRAKHAIYSNLPEDTVRRAVAPVDIAETVYSLLSHVPTGKTVHYVYSDAFTGKMLVEALAKALEMPDLKYVEITDEQYAQSMLTAGIPRGIVEPFVQSTIFERQPEKLYADLAVEQTPAGNVKLADFAKQFAAAYQAGPDGPRAQTIVS